MISREAFWYIMPIGIIAALLQFEFPFYSIPFWLLILFLGYLFRNPVYDYSSDPLGIVSPVDSVITSISKAEDPYMKRNAIRIEFEMDLTDPYILRSFTEGKIANVWMRHPDTKHKSKIRAARIQTDEGDDAVMEVYPSRSRQIMCYYAAGERVGQGKKCGFLPFGSKVVIYLPEHSIVEVKPGERVLAGKDIIAHWPRS